MEVIDSGSEIGLPVTLKGLGIEEVKPEQIMEVARLACAPMIQWGICHLMCNQKICMLRSWVRMLWADIIRKSTIADYFISIDM